MNVFKEKDRIFSTAAEALCLPFKLERSAGILWNLNTGIGKSVSLRKTKQKLILFKDHYLLACRVELSGGGEINIIIVFIETNSMPTIFQALCAFDFIESRISWTVVRNGRINA